MNRASTTPFSQSATAGRWLWWLGAAGIVAGARLTEVHLHSGPTPLLDQWFAEGRQILVPWLQGRLSWTAFFAPHNEHIPAWTRLSAWLQAGCFSRWDPQLEATFNAVWQGVFAGTLAGWLRRSLPLWPAFILTLLVVTLGSLPFSWENSTWGFQTHTPLALLFVFLHIRGSFTHPVASPRWWLAQAAGLAAFFTYGSMFAAPLAVLVTVLWTAAPDRRRWIVPTLLTIGGVALLLTARSQQDPATTLTLAAHSPREFLADFLLQLGWPASWPGACIVLFLPAVLLAAQLRQRTSAENLDRVILALALWAAAQAAAFAYGRGGGYIGFVSRYGDLLALGVVANAVALWRWLQAARGWRLWAALVVLIVWAMTVTQGLRLISTRGHTEYFHARSAQWTQVRREAVTRYLASRDIAELSSPEVRRVLYPDPQVVAQVLDQPGLVDLLPASLRPDPARKRGDFLSAAAEAVRSLASELMAGAAVLLVLGVWLTRRTGALWSPPLVPVADPWQLRLTGLLALVASGLVFLWPKPLDFSAGQQWHSLLNPPGTVQKLTFHLTPEGAATAGSPAGAAALWPEDFRARFFGTLVGGPAFKGTAQSSAFPISSPWLVIPFAGFPASPGNGLYLRIEDAAGNTLKDFIYSGPNPSDIDFWAVDVHDFIGQSARIVLYDGRGDTESWVAVAPPQATSGAERAETARQERLAQPARFGQQSLALIALVALLVCGVTAIGARRRRA